jgi:hypothetical protein
VGVLPQNLLAVWMGFPPPAALWRAIALPSAIAEASLRRSYSKDGRQRRPMLPRKRER